MRQNNDTKSRRIQLQTINVHNHPYQWTMDWFKGNFTGKPHIQCENLWFPVDFPLNQSIDHSVQSNSQPEMSILYGIIV